MWVLKGETLYAPQNYCHKNINFAFGFFGICGHHILDYLCLFEVYYISFRLELVYLKKYSNKHLQTWPDEIYLCQNKHITKYEKLQIHFKTKVMGGIL